MEIAIVFIVLLTIILIMIMVIHNGIIRRYNSAKQAWADVIALERQKDKILPELEKIAEQYKIHEATVLTSIIELRNALKNLSNTSVDVEQLKTVQVQTRHLIGSFYAVSENYPNLKASSLYNNLIKEITEQQNNIGAEIRIYNSNVTQFNIDIEVFSNTIINNNITKKSQIDLFSDSEASNGFEFKPNF